MSWLVSGVGAVAAGMGVRLIMKATATNVTSIDAPADDHATAKGIVLMGCASEPPPKMAPGK
jgi:hypothetical protein